MEKTARRIYGIKINYRIMNDFLSRLGEMRAAKRRGYVSEQFGKRIMLAVTQVNGCAMCSYFHTKEALKMGMPEQEIKSILSGELGAAPEEEAVALRLRAALRRNHRALRRGRVPAPRPNLRRTACPQHTLLYPGHHDGQRAGQHHGRLKIALSRQARAEQFLF